MKLRPGSHDRTKRPVRAKAAEGNRSNRAEKSIAAADDPVGDAPAWFSPRRAEIWRDVIGSAPRGAVSRSDVETASDYCVAIDNLRLAVEKLDHEVDHLSRSKVMVEIAKWQQIKTTLAREMGMTPMARARLAIDDEPAAAERELAALIGM